MNIYENCPVIENDDFTLRIISNADTKDLLSVYSDEKVWQIINADNCDDNFHYTTLERMQQAVDFWVIAYKNGWFVRWTVVDKHINKAVGTFEAFHRESQDSYNGYGLLRLDLNSNYENKTAISFLLKLIMPNVYKYFDCTKCITKAVPQAVERVAALQDYGFVKSELPLIAPDNKQYFDYWVAEK